MALPAKPSEFSLGTNSRLLKHMVKDLQAAANARYGLTSDDVTAAENFAWRLILSSFVAQYDISGWETSPPIPLFEVFDLLASGHLLRMHSQRQNVEESEERPTYQRWIEEAKAMIKAILDPPDEGNRMSLIDSDGAEIYPRSDVAVPEVLNVRDTVFFPEYKTDTSHGLTTDQSVEQLYRERSQPAS